MVPVQHEDIVSGLYIFFFFGGPGIFCSTLFWLGFCLFIYRVGGLTLILAIIYTIYLLGKRISGVFFTGPFGIFFLSIFFMHVYMMS